MKEDAINWARKGPQCQKHTNLIHAPSVQKNSLKTPYSFHTWTLEEKREVVGSKIEEYHRRLALAYDKHVRPRVFLEGDLVLKSVDTVMKNMLCQNELPNGRVLILFLKYTPTDIASY
ncbi:hypothetical protein Ahy_A07g035383 isoform B [Arachis hypogaea]|uniref:Uncharacterized protein n=1 Tax=Arachis hypogaea TaxID=3818 RepID=A0A445CE03_ARAHY|nr:hypothetical protein Ahy_A07g035383 isoform B [Arachis hypogaea]